MEIELEKSRNELLSRTNVLVKIRAIKTPSRQELIKKVAAMLGVDEQLIVIDKIAQNFGQRVSNAYLKVYDNAKALKEIELNYKIKRTGSLDEEKSEEPKAEPKVEPKEESKEEPKEESKEEPKKDKE